MAVTLRGRCYPGLLLLRLHSAAAVHADTVPALEQRAPASEAETPDNPLHPAHRRTDIHTYMQTTEKKKISHRQLGPLRGSSSPFQHFEPARVKPGPKIVCFWTQNVQYEIVSVCAVALLAMKWSNVTDFKWKSDNLVCSSCTVIMVSRFFSKEIFKIVATRCHLLRLKCAIFDFGEGGEGGIGRKGKGGEKRRCAVGISNYFRLWVKPN